MKPPFSADPHRANLWFHLLLLNSPLRINTTPTFLGVIFDGTLFFSRTYVFAEVSVFPWSRGFTLYICFVLGPSKESHSLLYKAISRPVFFSFTGMVSISQRSQRYSWNTFTKRPVVPFLASPISLPLSSASRFLLRVTLTRFALSSYNRDFCLPTSVPISGFARLGEKLKIF